MGKKQHANLGKALINKNKIQWSRKTNAERHTKEDTTSNLKSVTEESSYDEFIATAALAQKDFTAEKLNIKFVGLNTNPIDLNATDVTEEEKKLVVVPRRPKWTKTMTAQELDDAEKEAFLEWRRSMAVLQEKQGITPFERNIEVWRQLWRVIEKSDIVIQIVDARNPLLYRCDDLEKYVREMGKRPVLLINKADYLSEEQRRHWSEYFNGIELPHAFYSAVAATEALKKATIQEEDESVEQDDDGSGSDQESGNDVSDEEDSQVQDEVQPPESAVNASDSTSAPSCDCVSKYAPFGTAVLGRDGLVDFLRSFNTDSKEILNVGLVGYPNVGKSSTINSLVACKKTSVSSTPGKTKHFQTLYLEQDILLCDCPGLVMPAYGGSKGAMVLGGILPIDQLRDHAPAMALLKEQIPRPVIEHRYGITLPDDYNHDDILSSYAHVRGFMTARGLPDNSRAARLILKDYVEGRLNYCHAPPSIEQREFHPDTNYPDYNPKVKASSGKEQTAAPKKCTLRKPNAEKSLDTQFFQPVDQAAHIKGRMYIASGLSTNSSSSSLTDKPWKKHNNKHKKEKLRRVYRHLDVE